MSDSIQSVLQAKEVPCSTLRKYEGYGHLIAVMPSALDDLLEALSDLEPRDPEVPYFSSTLWDPNDRPSFAADYWADNLRYTVRFASAVQAALNDGFRVFGELAPHPLLTHAVDQNAASLDMPIAALAAMRKNQPLGRPEQVPGHVGIPELPQIFRGALRIPQ